MTARGDETRLAAGAILRGDALAGPHLVVAAGPEAGRRLPLAAVQTLGRGRGADLRLADPAASRVHLRLTQVGGRYVAEDLGSRNGVQVNGVPCRRPRPLDHGDELRIGETRLVLTPGILDGGPSTADPRAPIGPRRRPLPAVPILLAAAATLAATAAVLLAIP